MQCKSSPPLPPPLSTSSETLKGETHRHIQQTHKIYLFGLYIAFNTVQVISQQVVGRAEYIQLVKVLYCKLQTNGKQLPAFPLEVGPGTKPRSQMWEAKVLLLSQWISSSQWSSSPALYGNIKEFLLWTFGIHVYLVAESSYSIYLNMNIACLWAFLQQVTNFTGVTKFTGWAVPLCHRGPLTHTKAILFSDADSVQISKCIVLLR